MRALQLDLTPLLLHHLPHDVLVAILQRTSADDLDRVEAVPCRAVSCAARADILWGAAVRRCFGAALAARVAASLEGEPAEGEGEGVPERVPGWLSETVRLSWTMQQAFIASYRAWHAQPTMRTAYRILARLVPPSFASDPQAWVQKLTSGEPREEDKARVLAFFVQMNARRWARARDSAADDVNEHRRVTSVLAHYLTTPKGAEGSSLARATCRAYTHSFDLAGLDLVAAIRLFMHETQMPKEARRMCHLFWSFAGAYYEQNGGYVPPEPRDLIKGPRPDADAVPNHGRWRSHDHVYLMVMSLVFLNADAHNPAVTTKLSEQTWVRSTMESLRMNATSSSRLSTLQASYRVLDSSSSSLGASEVTSDEEEAAEAALGEAYQADSLIRMYRNVSALPLLSLNDYTSATSSRSSVFRRHQSDGWRARISSAIESLSAIILS
jgi:hypothetical protein